MKLSSFEQLSPLQKDFVSTKTCVINDEDASKVIALKEFMFKDTIATSRFTFDLLKENIDSLKQNSIKIITFKPTDINASINLSENEMIYTSLPFDKGWTIKDNGKEIDKVILSGGMTGFMLNKGEHSLEFKYTSLNLRKGLYISLISFCIFIGLFSFFSKRKIKQEEII